MLSEFKQYTWKFYILQIIGLLILFCMSVGYVDDMGKGYSIFGLLFDKSNVEILRNSGITFIDIWSNGISTYTSFLYPLIICLGYSFSVFYDKKGVRRYVLLRKSRLKYCLDKVTGAVISSGFVFGVAYLVFGVIVMLKMSYVMPELNVTPLYLLKLLCSFAYGMEISLFFIIVSVFCKDKYELMCLPILIKYFVLVVSNRVLLIGMQLDNEIIISISYYVLNPENIVSNYSSIKEKLVTIVVSILVYFGSVFLMNYMIKRDEKYGNI